MIRISTTFFKNLSEKDKKEIQLAASKLGQIEIYEYIQKGLGLEEVTKFILDGFILKNFIRDALLWDYFKLLLQKIFDIVVKKSKKPPEVQIWIKDISNVASINITFSIKNKEDIQNFLTPLRTKLDAEIFSPKKELQKGKIFWLAFDKETNIWTIQIL